ncbi:phosphotransferase [Archangium minus]|uniref:Phosphotransferase n=1 Tax=Archangium minus TaxID=83450 RepID=A0ABY9X4R5_9BACT|nr:phosphotransferase [Archangium minus]
MGLFKPVQLHHVAILWHPSEPRVLAVPTREGLALPSFMAEEKHPAEAGHVIQRLKGRLGVPMTVLQCLGNFPGQVGAPPDRVYVLESHGPASLRPTEGEWLDVAHLHARGLPPVHQRLIDSWLEQRSTPPRHGREWSAPGWWDEATAWIARALHAAGWGNVQEIEQLRTWEFSCVLRIRAARGECFFKALPPSYSAEPRLVLRLQETHPALIPEVLATNLERRWLLLAAAGGELLESVSDPSAWEAAARAYAELQRQWTRHEARTSLGLNRLPLEALEREFDALLADDAALLLDTPEGLTRAQVERLRAQAEELKGCCRELAALGIPETLEHGDLWPSNIFVTPRGPVFIDWTDAVIAPPLLGAWMLLEGPQSEALLGRSPGARERVSAAYLRPWAEEWGQHTLERAFTLARRIAPAFHAWKLYREVLPHLETREIGEVLPFLLKRLLSDAPAIPRGSVPRPR